MANTTNYGWETPDDTDLVKDGASAIRTLGSSIDTTTKNLNPETTTGDISYRSATSNVNTRLAIGTTGQILTVAGGVPTWAAPTASVKNFSLLNAGGTSLSGSSTVTVSGITDKDEILVYIVGASSGSSAYNVAVRVNGLSTSIYNARGPYINAGSGYSASNFGSRTNTAASSITIGEWSDNTSSVMDGWFRISGGATAGVKVVDFQTGSSAASGNGQDLVWGGGYIDTTATITSVSLIQTESVNFDAGTVYVYTSA